MKIKIRLIFILISLFSLTSITYSNENVKQKPTVNALAFFGFLDNPKISQVIEKKCGVNFSHDSYPTNAEFLNIFNSDKNNYDVIIFSNLIYGSIKNKLPVFPSNLWKVSNNYYPYFKKYYQSHNYTHNTAFFTHAMVGFMYNPSVIQINPKDKIFDIFKKAKDNDVILVDDSGEIGNMLTVAYNQKYNTNKQSKLTYKNLKELTQNAHVYITSEFNNVYDSKKFAFAYIWSGDALLYTKKTHKTFKFLMPKPATSICTDLLVQMKDTPQAKCVANALASPELLKYFENDSYYFSPYFKNNVNNMLYTDVYNQVKKNLNNYIMIEPVYDFEKYYNQRWEKIKLAYYLENEKR